MCYIVWKPRGADLRTLAWIAAVVMLGLYAQAAEKKPEIASDEAAIRAAVESYVAAYNRGDAKAVAAHWSDSGEWISPSGQRFQGRQAIEKEMQTLFAENKGVRIEVHQPVHSHRVARRGHRGGHGSRHSPCGAAERFDLPCGPREEGRPMEAG